MDIRNWPLDRIMQLPDCAFGRRWPVSVAIKEAILGTYYDINELALPERCVVWSVFWIPNTTAGAHTRITLSLGDVLPADDAQFDAFEPVFRDLGYWDGARRVVGSHAYTTAFKLSVRQPIQSMGRRLVGRFEQFAGSPYPTYAGLVISSIPTEVLDWLISGPARSL